jgi:hypothetical protein
MDRFVPVVMLAGHRNAPAFSLRLEMLGFYANCPPDEHFYAKVDKRKLFPSVDLSLLLVKPRA